MVAYTATSPFEISDFSGGKTDYYLDSLPNKYQEADNFLILKHGRFGKLFTRPGSELFDIDNPQIAAGAQRINYIKEFEDDLYVMSARKLYYFTGSATGTITGPTGNDMWPSGVDVNTLINAYEWNKHLFVTNEDYNKVSKIYKNSGGTRYLRTAGLPRPASTPTITPGAGANSYLYRLVYKYEYEAGSLTFIDRGGFVEDIIYNADAPDSTAVGFTGIAVLSNGTDLNYDTSNIVVEIYRTTNGGTVFYYVDEVTNGTTTYSDTLDDTTLQTRALLYTEGGVPENGEPPLCKCLHVMDDKGYYGNIKEGSEINTARLYQSSPGDIDSVPELNFVDLQDEIVGISSIRSSPIVFCKNVIYRLDGSFDVVGQGFITPDKISDTAGCVSANSIVQTVLGVFWAGNDGFYYTDGYRVFKVSDDIDETYQGLVKDQDHKNRIQGVFDSKKLRVWWAVQSVDANADNDSCYVLDLNWGVKPQMPFTTISGGENFAPTSIEFTDNNLIRSDKRGYLFRHRDTLFSDPKVDTGTAAADWTQATILYNYISSAINFGTSSARKFVPRIVVEASNETDLSLQITSINDDGRRSDELRPIRYRGNFTWGEPDVYWGDPTLLWGNQGLIVRQRRFPAKGLRCQYKQVQFSNAKVAIVSSDLIGTASVNNVLKTVTLDNTSDYDWPTLAVDLVIAFENDGYVKEFTITARTDDVLTFSDPTGASPLATGTKWVLRGTPKNEIMQLIGYSIDYMVFGRTVSLYRSGSTGEVST